MMQHNKQHKQENQPEHAGKQGECCTHPHLFKSLKHHARGNRDLHEDAFTKCEKDEDR